MSLKRHFGVSQSQFRDYIRLESTNLVSDCEDALSCAMQVQYGQRVVSSNKLRKYLRTFQVPKAINGQIDILMSFPVELRDVMLHSVSPSGMAFPCHYMRKDHQHQENH